MSENKKMIFKKTGLLFGLFLVSALFGYYFGRHGIPFFCWLFHGLVRNSQVIPFICLAVFLFGCVHTIINIRKKKEKPFLFYFIITLGIGFGGLLLVDNEGDWFYNYDYGYSSFSKDKRTIRGGNRIGLINKWGTKVVPCTCDIIFLYNDETQGEESFIGAIVKEDIKLYSFSDYKGEFLETVPFTSIEELENWIDAEYGSVIYSYVGSRYFVMETKYELDGKNFSSFSAKKKKKDQEEISSGNIDFEEDTDDVVETVTEEREPTKIEVEIKRDPVPVQVWEPCGGCYNGNTGLCYQCQGTGRNIHNHTTYQECNTCGGSGKCIYCNGKGGSYHTEYR